MIGKFMNAPWACAGEVRTLSPIQRVFIGLIGIILFGIGSIAPAAAQTVVHTKQFPNAMVNLNANVAGNGDGYVAIPHKDRIYFMNHHAQISATATIFGCIEKDPGSNSCAGFGTASLTTVGMYLRTLPDGASSGLNSSTSSANEEYAIVGDRWLYYPVTRFAGNSGAVPQDWGVGCFDLTTNSECTYHLLSANPNNRNYRVAVEGPFQVGNRLYFLDLDMVLHCIEVNAGTGAMADCAAPKLDLYTNNNTKLPRFTSDSDSTAGHIGGEVVDSKLYLTIIYHGNSLEIPVTAAVTGGKAAVCISTSASSMSACSGWSSAKQFGTTERHDNFSNYIYYDSDLSMTPLSICNRNALNQSCLKLSDGSDSASLSHVDVADGDNLGMGLGREVRKSTVNKTYFPSFFGSQIYCFDWSTQAQCSNYSITSLVPNPRDYALSMDSAGCLWALGHRSQLWSLDPITQTSPCGRGSFTGVVAKTCSAAKWLGLKVFGITATDFASLEIRIKDNTGTTVLFDLLDPGQNPVDLSTAQFNGVDPLEYEVHAVIASNLTQFTTTPVVEVTDDWIEGMPCDSDATLKICKIAGEDVEEGTLFWFDVEGVPAPVSVPAGPAEDGGYCQVIEGVFNEGDDVKIVEIGPIGHAVEEVTAPPGVSLVVSLEEKTAFVKIVAGVTEVTFRNRERWGYLEICKWTAVPGDYTFTIPEDPSIEPFVVHDNTCSPLRRVPADTFTIVEADSASSQLAWCFAYPAENGADNCDLETQSYQVTVHEGGPSTQTMVFFLNGPAGDAMGAAAARRSAPQRSDERKLREFLKEAR